MHNSHLQMTNKRSAKRLCSLLFGLLLIAGLAVPALAQKAKYKKDEEVIVDVTGNDSEAVEGVIEQVYVYAREIKYSVKYMTKYGYSQSVYVLEGQVRPRQGAAPSGDDNAVRNDAGGDEPKSEPSQPTPDEADNSGGEDTGGGSVSFFIGRWDVLSSVGRNTSRVERSDGDYSVTSTVVGKQPPLTINADGTYKWASNTSGTKIITGRWRAATK